MVDIVIPEVDQDLPERGSAGAGEAQDEDFHEHGSESVIWSRGSMGLEAWGIRGIPFVSCAVDVRGETAGDGVEADRLLGC